MQTLRMAGKTLLCAAAVLMLAVPAMAGNGKGSGGGQGSGDRTRTQDRLKDGSCQDAIEKSYDNLQQLAGNGKGRAFGPGDGTGTKSRPKDGTGYGSGASDMTEPSILDFEYFLTGNGNGHMGDNEEFGPGDGICDNA
ncbi:MAG: hypothetical protein JZU50_03105 [Desulfobulbaceae bacterium]|nr:hypothetical protein [Desulfobulbaceae bacterium]